MGENQAAYCGRCDLVFDVEERDLFLGQAYCPSCTQRTAEEDRGGLREIKVAHPQARYQPARQVA